MANTASLASIMRRVSPLSRSSRTRLSDTVEILLGLCEGGEFGIEGLSKQGGQDIGWRGYWRSIYINDVPLLDKHGNFAFDDVKFAMYKGLGENERVPLASGYSGSAITKNITLHPFGGDYVLDPSPIGLPFPVHTVTDISVDAVQFRLRFPSLFSPEPAGSSGDIWSGNFFFLLQMKFSDEPESAWRNALPRDDSLFPEGNEIFDEVIIGTSKANTSHTGLLSGSALTGSITDTKEIEDPSDPTKTIQVSTTLTDSKEGVVSSDPALYASDAPSLGVPKRVSSAVGDRKIWDPFEERDDLEVEYKFPGDLILSFNRDSSGNILSLNTIKIIFAKVTVKKSNGDEEDIISLDADGKISQEEQGGDGETETIGGAKKRIVSSLATNPANIVKVKNQFRTVTFDLEEVGDFDNGGYFKVFFDKDCYEIPTAKRGSSYRKRMLIISKEDMIPDESFKVGDLLYNTENLNAAYYNGRAFYTCGGTFFPEDFKKTAGNEDQAGYGYGDKLQWHQLTWRGVGTTGDSEVREENLDIGFVWDKRHSSIRGTKYDKDLLNNLLGISAKRRNAFTVDLIVPLPYRVSGSPDVQFRLWLPFPHGTNPDTAVDPTLESITELRNDPIQLKKLAALQVVVPFADKKYNEKGVSIMSRIKGCRMRIPTNYNPLTRIYHSLWDGEFKIGYTNNPAWCVLHMVLDTEFGLANSLPVGLKINKWSFYEAARFCDHLVEGKPRFTFNKTFSEKMNIRTAIDSVCQIFGGRLHVNNFGEVSVSYDHDNPPVAIFTNALTSVNDPFVYSSTALSERYNSIVVSYNNVYREWRAESVQYKNDTLIDKYGLIENEFEAFGCNTEDEAVRRTRYNYIKSQKEVLKVSFVTGKHVEFLKVDDNILILDTEVEAGTSAIIRRNNLTTVFFKNPVNVVSGTQYRVYFQVSNPTYQSNFSLLSRTFTPTQSTITSATFSDPIPQTLPASSVCILRPTSSPEPTIWRIIDKSPSEGGAWKLMCRNVYPERLAFTDETSVADADIDIESGEDFDSVETVEKIWAYLDFVEDRTPILNFHLKWIESSIPVKHYEVFYQVRGEKKVYFTTKNTTLDLKNLPDKDIIFGVSSVSLSGDKKSNPCVTAFQSRWGFMKLAQPTNLRSAYLRAETETDFRGKSPAIKWEYEQRADIAGFDVTVTINGIDLRTERLNPKERSYTYSFKDYLSDRSTRTVSEQANLSETEIREVTFKVIAKPTITYYADLSVKPTITLSNPRLFATPVAVVQEEKNIKVTWAQSSSPYYKDTLVYYSTTGFDGPYILGGLSTETSFILSNTATSGNVWVRIKHRDLEGDLSAFSGTAIVAIQPYVSSGAISSGAVTSSIVVKEPSLNRTISSTVANSTIYIPESDLSVDGRVAGSSSSQVKVDLNILINSGVCDTGTNGFKIAVLVRQSGASGTFTREQGVPFERNADDKNKTLQMSFSDVFTVNDEEVTYTVGIKLVGSYSVSDTFPVVKSFNFVATHLKK